MSYYVTNENSFLDIKNAHLRVTGNVHTDVLKVGSIGFQPAGSNISGTVNFTNVTTGVTTTSNLNVGGTLNLGTIELSASTHTLDHITARGNVTSTTVQFDNATTGLVTTSNVEVGGELTVSGNVEVGGELTISGNVEVGGGVVSNVNLLSVSNVASIKKDSNVVTEFPRSKKLIKFPRVAIANGSTASGGVQTPGLSGSQDGFVATSSSSWGGGGADSRGAWCAFDEGTSSTTYKIWQSGNFYTTATPGVYNRSPPQSHTADGVNYEGEWIKLELPHKINVSTIEINSAGYSTLTSHHNARPYEGAILGSNDDTNWSLLKSFSGGLAWTTTTVHEGASRATLTPDTNTTNYYRYLMLVVNKIQGSRSSVDINEIRYYGYLEHDTDAHATDVVVKSETNVPNTDWLEVYYDAKDLENGSTTVNDLKPTGTAINGTVNGNTTVSNGAFTFDQGDDFISLDTGKTGNYIFTVSLWFKSSGSSVETLFHMNGDYATNNTVWIYGSGTSLSIDFVNNSYNCYIGRQITDNNWHHASFVYNGDGTYGRDIYLDGVRLDGFISGTNAGNNLSLTNTSSISRIGALNHSSGIIHEFKGSIANFRLFNRPLNSNEIYQLYAYQKEYFGHGDLNMNLKAGRLGIGTSEPRAALDVGGDLRVDGHAQLETLAPRYYSSMQRGTFHNVSSHIITGFDHQAEGYPSPVLGWEVHINFNQHRNMATHVEIDGGYLSNAPGTHVAISEVATRKYDEDTSAFSFYTDKFYLGSDIANEHAAAYAVIRITNSQVPGIPSAIHAGSGQTVRYHMLGHTMYVKPAIGSCLDVAIGRIAGDNNARLYGIRVATGADNITGSYTVYTYH